MTYGLRAHGIRAIVLDIEGTTTPVAFVYEVLFPFARAHLRQYLEEHAGTAEVSQAIARLRAEWSDEVARGDAPPEVTDDDPESIAAYVEWLMDRDRKSPGLKLLQGHIWESGYRSGALVGEVFDDVPPALRRWRDARVDVAIFSSGSVLAQRLLFGHTPYGDLTPLIDAWFDTASGPKTSPDSYRRIAADMRCEADGLLFVSDVTAELDAARAAGYRTLLCVRPGNAARARTSESAIVQRFDEIVP